jgi:hypothetical protein
VLLLVFLCVYYLIPKHRLALPCTPGIQRDAEDPCPCGEIAAGPTSLAAGGNSSSFGELAEATGAAPATGPQLKLPQWRH